MAKNFQDLIDKMSPERRARIRAEADRMSAGIDRRAEQRLLALGDEPGVTMADFRRAVETLGGTLEITIRFPPPERPPMATAEREAEPQLAVTGS